MLRVSYGKMNAVLLHVLLKVGFELEQATLCGRLIANASRRGVPSLGLNCFQQFVRMIQSTIVDVHAELEWLELSTRYE
jgi:LDH2 family malate/lactate/ureidoglycolate dehydrogenase